MKRAKVITLLLVTALSIVFLFGCAKQKEISIAPTSDAQVTPTITSVVTPTATPSPVPTPSPTPEPERFYEGIFEYYIEGDGAVITGAYAGKIDKIPDTLGGKPIVKIADNAFTMVGNLFDSNFILPETIVSIGNRAFSGLKIKKLMLPDSVTSIGEEAFYQCYDLENITLSKNLTFMGDRAFSECYNLEKITIPEGVTYIGNEAFADIYSIGLSEGGKPPIFSIPSSVVYIGKNAFSQSDLSELKIEISSDNKMYRMEGRSLLSTDGKTLYEVYYDESKVETIYGEKTLRSVTYDENGGKTEDWDLGISHRLKDGTYIIPDGIETIKAGCFNNRIYNHIIIPASVKNIENGAFAYIMSIWDRLTIEVSSENSSFMAFNNMLMDKDKKRILKSFNYSYRMTIPTTVETIDAYAFVGTLAEEFTTFEIPSGVTSIGDYAFRWSDLQSIVIPDSVKTIGRGAFSQSGIAEIVFPKGIAMISDELFEAEYGGRSSAQFKSIVIPDGVVSVGEKSFYQCEELTDVSLPEGLQEIGSDAFFMCAKLDNISLPSSLADIGARAFYDCENLKQITLPDGLVSVGDSAFSDAALTELVIPDSVMFLGRNAFFGTDVVKITIPDTIEKISNGLFSACGSLTEVTIPNSVKAIGAEAFSYCRSLSTINLPKELEVIGPRAFFSCDGLTSISIPGKIFTIPTAAFSQCDNLQEVIIEEGVKEIGSFAFYCDNLISITIPASVERIDDEVFNPYDRSLIIHSPEGSYASEYAANHGIKCVYN